MSDGRQSLYLDDYQAMLDELDAGLDDAFNIRPKAGVEVVEGTHPYVTENIFAH